MLILCHKFNVTGGVAHTYRTCMVVKSLNINRSSFAFALTTSIAQFYGLETG